MAAWQPGRCKLCESQSALHTAQSRSICRKSSEVSTIFHSRSRLTFCFCSCSLLSFLFRSFGFFPPAPSFYRHHGHLISHSHHEAPCLLGGRVGERVCVQIDPKSIGTDVRQSDYEQGERRANGDHRGSCHSLGDCHPQLTGWNGWNSPAGKPAADDLLRGRSAMEKMERCNLGRGTDDTLVKGGDVIGLPYWVIQALDASPIGEVASLRCLWL